LKDASVFLLGNESITARQSVLLSRELSQAAVSLRSWFCGGDLIDTFVQDLTMQEDEKRKRRTTKIVVRRRKAPRDDNQIRQSRSLPDSLTDLCNRRNAVNKFFSENRRRNEVTKKEPRLEVLEAASKVARMRLLKDHSLAICQKRHQWVRNFALFSLATILLKNIAGIHIIPWEQKLLFFKYLKQKLCLKPANLRPALISACVGIRTALHVIQDISMELLGCTTQQ